MFVWKYTISKFNYSKIPVDNIGTGPRVSRAWLARVMCTYAHLITVVHFVSTELTLGTEITGH